MALGSEVGTATFVQADISNLGDSRVVGSGASKGVIVPRTTVDAYCESNGIRQVQAMKIDVQGAELAVLKGAERLLTNTPPRVIKFESCPSMAGGAEDEVFALLRRFGYRFLALKGSRPVEVSRQDPAVFDYLALAPGAEPRAAPAR